jgi:putative spermidine/putrescine transport system permease protein
VADAARAGASSAAPIANESPPMLRVAPNLKAQLRSAERSRLRRDLFMIVIPVLFVVFVFAAPVATFLFYSVDNWEIGKTLPRTLVALEGWDGRTLPDDKAFAGLAADMRAARAARTAAELGRRLNYHIDGFRSLIMDTARNLPRVEIDSDPRAVVLAADARWGDLEYWRIIRQESGRLTPFYLLAALDLRRAFDGNIVAVPPDRTIFVDVILRTFTISTSVTVMCLLLGFPVAYLLATLPTRTANLLFIFVLLPFWTSLLVRSTAWIILLQNEGILNKALIRAGFTTAPIQLVYNRIGVVMALTHVMLPFMVLPIYSVMKGIPRHYMLAASSLGANWFVAFRRVYLPQAFPGIAAGCVICFVMVAGYYITPLLLGGPRDQMLAYFVAFFTNQSNNWGLAAALGTVLLVITLTLLAIFHRLFGVEKLRLRT